ncbi:hypothetical protein [Propionibacterium ruminifibrarum]|uniref:hypothetical protein n=1 Tax=Propionibacterium ruminifibrarum TaxID=1962131 RepID=UPI000E6B2534|nr:hypothetical protein [Propionibacterium ruminifibrarum]
MMVLLETVVTDELEDHVVTALSSRASHHGHTTMKDSTGVSGFEVGDGFSVDYLFWSMAQFKSLSVSV